MWFCHVSKVPALLESQVEEKTCSDSEGAGSSECSDAESEEQGDGACSKKPSPDLEVDRKVSQEHRPPCPLLFVQVSRLQWLELVLMSKYLPL